MVNGTHTDTHTEAASTDTVQTAEHTDRHTTQHGHVLEHEAHLYGNIGITTSQEMAEQELSLWSKLNFYDIIFEDIITLFCNLVVE